MRLLHSEFNGDACECALSLSAVLGIEVDELRKTVKKDIRELIDTQAKIKYKNKIKYFSKGKKEKNPYFR